MSQQKRMLKHTDIIKIGAFLSDKAYLVENRSLAEAAAVVFEHTGVRIVEKSLSPLLREMDIPYKGRIGSGKNNSDLIKKIDALEEEFKALRDEFRELRDAFT